MSDRTYPIGDGFDYPPELQAHSLLESLWPESEFHNDPARLERAAGRRRFREKVRRQRQQEARADQVLREAVDSVAVQDCPHCDETGLRRDRWRTPCNHSSAVSGRAMVQQELDAKRKRGAR